MAKRLVEEWVVVEYYGTLNPGMRLSAFAEDHGHMSWMNATVGHPEVRRANEGASADSAEDKEGYHGCKPVEASLKTTPQPASVSPPQ